jgi:hypothetical protein
MASGRWRHTGAFFLTFSPDAPVSFFPFGNVFHPYVFEATTLGSNAIVELDI